MSNSESSVPIPQPKRGWRKRTPLTPKQVATRETKRINRRIEKHTVKRKANDDALRSARKRRNALEQISSSDDSTLITTDVIDTLPEELQELINNANIIFRPNAGPQTDFLAASEREVLYGGAAGGGKSYAILADASRDAGNGNHRAIIIRRTNDELRELISKSHELYPQAYPGAKFRQQQSTWVFPSGASIWFTYLEKDTDVLRYQGQAFNYIAFDELTQWPTPYTWDYMRSRLRTTDSKLKLYMRATTNPGGPGSWWVRRMFIDVCNWGEAFWATDLETDKTLIYPPKHKKAGQPLFKRRFIPARLQDNPYLYEDGEYEANLLSMPESQRRQLLEGDWDVAENSAFPEFRRDTHVIEPFDIPHWWPRIRAMDWGYQQPSAVLWLAVDYDANIYVYRELYVSKMHPDTLAELIQDVEKGERITDEVLDGSVWAKRGDRGPSIAEAMMDNTKGLHLRWRPADQRPGSRISGKAEVHRRLALRDVGDGTQKPGLMLFNNCTNLIRTLPVMPLDKNNLEDVDTNSEDHAYDALRYGLMSRPMTPQNILFQDNTVFRPHQECLDDTFGY